MRSGDDGFVPSVTQILSATGLRAPLPEHFTYQNAAFRGRGVHQATQWYDEESPEVSNITDEEAPFVEAWADFRAVSGFEPVVIENVFYAQAFRFCGRLDRAGFYCGDPAIVDLKTLSVKRRLGPDVGWQVAGYEVGWLASLTGQSDEWILAQWGSQRLVEAVRTGRWRRFAVVLTPKGWDVQEFTDRRDKAVFLAAVTVFHAQLAAARSGAVPSHVFEDRYGVGGGPVQ